MPVWPGRIVGRPTGGTAGPGALASRLIQPGAIAPLLTFTRAQTAAFATAIGSDGTTWAEFAADVPRYQGTARQLLIEGQRTNNNRNPRQDGAVGGSPGTLPTNAQLLIPSGLTRTITLQTRNGIPGVLYELAGTLTGGGSVQLLVESNTQVVAATGEVWANAAFVQVDRFTGPTTVSTRVLEYTNVGGFLTGGTVDYTASRASLLRRQQVYTMAHASAARVNFAPIFTNTMAVSTVVDFAFWIGWPTMGVAAFASTPILPAVGSPAAATRGQDNVTASFATLFPAGVGSVLGSCMIPQSAPAGLMQNIFDLNDGTLNNRFRLRNDAGGNNIVAGIVSSGTPTDLTTLGAMTPGTLFRFGVTWDGTTITANFDGGTNQSLAGSFPGGLTTLRVGNNAGSTAPLGGEISYLDTYPYAIPAGALPAAVAAIP